MKISINELKKIIKSEIKNKLYEQTELEKKFYNRLNTLITNIKDELEQGNLPNFALYIDSYPNKSNPADIKLIAIDPNKMLSLLFDHSLECIKNLNTIKKSNINKIFTDETDLSSAVIPTINQPSSRGRGILGRIGQFFGGNRQQNILNDPADAFRVREMRKYIVESNSPEFNNYPNNFLKQKIDYKLLDGYLGYIHLRHPKQTITNASCFGGWQTYYTRAIGGNGPLMYSIAASYVKKEFGSGLKKYNKITSDKRSVSSDAQDVWEKTYNQRSDYEKYELDDGTKTPDTWDDCEIFPKSPYLNYAYEFKGQLNYENFLKVFDLFLDVSSFYISQLLNAFGYNSDQENLKNEIKSYLTEHGRTFYDLG